MTMKQIGIMEFWNRVDQVRKGTLEDLSKGTGIPHGTLKNFRTRKLLPSLADTSAIAEYLNVTLDWLVLGKVSSERDSRLSIVLKAYEGSDELTKILVRKVLNLE